MKPLIVALVNDLMFAVRIENVAGLLGYETRVIGQASAFGEETVDPTEIRPGERLYGQAGELFRRLSQWQPALLIFDLGNDQIPWRAWLTAIKSSPATRRLPVLCFGPHIDETALAEAADCGADMAVPRSRFASAMPRLIEELARSPDLGAVEAACAEPLADRALAGIAAFNRGEYYLAHEDLEEAWMADEGPGRDLYRAILQIAVAYYQIERDNYRGAVKMLLRVRQWLQPLPDRCRGVDVAGLRMDVENVYAALLAAGSEGLGDVDRSLFRPVMVE